MGSSRTYVLGIALSLCGVLAFGLSLGALVTSSGHDAPVLPLLGTIVVGPALFVAGFLMALRSGVRLRDLAGTAGEASRARKLVVALGVNVLVSIVLVAVGTNLAALCLAVVLLAASVCALVRNVNEDRFVPACLAASFGLTLATVLGLGALASSGVRYVLVVNGLRTSMTAAMGDVVGMLVLVVALPLLLSLPIGLLALGIYRVCAAGR